MIKTLVASILLAVSAHAGGVKVVTFPERHPKKFAHKVFKFGVKKPTHVVKVVVW